MKNQVRKEPALDLSSAAAAVRKAGEATARQHRPENEETKFVNLRIKETDYNRLKGLYGSAGLSLSAGFKMSALYLAEMVEQGAFILSAGRYIDKRN